jgi:hypothetical protein
MTSATIERNVCDVVAQVVQNGRIVSYLCDPQTGVFTSREKVTMSYPGLRALAEAPAQELTHAAATPGSGERIAFDLIPLAPSGQPPLGGAQDG